MMVLNPLQRKGHWLNVMTCPYARYIFLQKCTYFVISE